MEKLKNEISSEDIINDFKRISVEKGFKTITESIYKQYGKKQN